MSEMTMQRLQRSDTDRKLLGVCGGFAAHYGLDPLLVRITVAVLALFGGLGILLYLAGAAWLPEPGDPSDPMTGRRLPIAILAILAIIAALIVLPQFLFGFVDGSNFLVALGVIVLLVLLMRRPVPPAVPVPVAGSVPLPVPEAEFDQVAEPVAGDPAATAPDLMEEAPTAVQSYAAMPYQQLPPPPAAYGPPVLPEPAPPRPKSYLGAITLCASLIWFGLAWALNAAELTSLSAVTIFAGSLAILSVGLLIGAWYGRARWLVLFALPLSLVVWGLAAVPDSIHLGQAANWADDGFGDTAFTPTIANPDDFSWGFGSATLDLADWATYPGVQSIDASVGVGELVIMVPPNVDVIIQADVGLGSIVRDSTAVADGDSISNTMVFRAQPSDSDVASLRVDAAVDLGKIVVQTVPATEGRLS